jgi:hypothetical protein
MKIISANLYVDFEGERTLDFLQSNILQDLDADVILLQELHYKRKEQVDLALDKYTAQFPLTKGMDCMIYVKKYHTVTNTVYFKYKNTFMERGLFGIEINGIWYLTTHLESMDKEQFEVNRLKQLSEIWNFIKDKNKVILGMDSNLKTDIETPVNVTDVWLNDPVPTWFGERFFNHNSTARFDRFLTKNLSLIEKKIIVNKYSDHDILYINIKE